MKTTLRRRKPSPPKSPDLEIELEREELAALLDRALAELPADTRTALVQRYLLELPQAEIAARMGLSEGAVEARLHRGKLSLHQILLNRYQPEAAAFGLAQPGSAGWVETRIWCPICGQHHLYGALPQVTGQFELHCPACSWEPRTFFAQSTMIPEFEPVKGYRATLKRMMAYMDRLFLQRPENDTVRCQRCGFLVPLEFEIPPSVPRYPNLSHRGFYIRCPRCGRTSHSDIYGVALDTPAGQAFWRVNPRIRTLPEVEINLGDRPALLLRFESLAGSASLEVALDRSSYTLLSQR